MTAMMLALPIMMTPTMLFGLNWQLFASDYPEEWYGLRERLRTASFDTSCEVRAASESGRCFDLLVFPWHQYMGFDFARRIIANPASGFFGNVRTLDGDNMEFGKIYTSSSRPESRIVESYVGPGGSFPKGLDEAEAARFVADLKRLGIRRVLLLKESDFKKYGDWLAEIEKYGNVSIAEDNAKLTLYLVR
jgi:hypothetical protein